MQMLKFLIVSALVGFLGVTPHSSAETESTVRRALLIGMKDYNETVGPLKNTHKDVQLMADALEAAGFDVELLLDDVPNGVTVSRSKILSTLRRHAQAIATAPDAISFVYYSGHGAANEEDNRNYIIPQNVESIATAELWDESLKLEDAIDRLTLNAPAAAHFVVFDACRNELKLPTTGRNLSKGFVAEQAPGGVFLAFSTAEGQVAQDGSEADIAGPFAKALADQITLGGQNHVTMFLRAAQEVKRSIGQTPYIETGLLQEIYLNGTDGSIINRPAVTTPETSSDRANSGSDAAPLSQRKALIVSNSAYSEPFTPVVDAHATGERVAEAMQASGFDVVHLQDPSRTVLLTEAAEMLTGFAGDAFEKLAVVHYIGHVKGLSDAVNRGLSAGATNYLIPTRAPIRSSFDLPIHAVELGRLVDLASAQDGVSSVFIIDGCRAEGAVNIDQTENCVIENERDNVMITINQIAANTEADEDDDDTTPPVQSYSDRFAEELIIGGSITDVVTQTNAKQAEASSSSASPQTSGTLNKDYTLAPVTQAELDVAQALKNQTVTKWVAENRPDLLAQRDAELAEPVRTNGAITNSGIDMSARPVARLDLNLEPASPTACFEAVQDKIAWDATGNNRRWNASNIDTLCSGQESSKEPAKCFDGYMQLARDASRSPRWQDASRLCRGSASAPQTLSCFKQAIASPATNTPSQAIDRCKAP